MDQELETTSFLGHDLPESQERARLEEGLSSNPCIETSCSPLNYFSAPSYQNDNCRHGCLGRYRHVIIGALVIFVISSTILLTFPRSACNPTTSGLGHLPSFLSDRNFTCGTTREEAISAQCVFDLMSFTWTHADCYDGALTEQFLSLQSWQWWHDSQGEFVANETLVRHGLFPSLHVTWKYHKLHCVYMMRKMQRAVAMGRPIDGYIADPGHTHHCLGRLDIVGVELDKVNTEIMAKFPSCLWPEP